MTDPVDTLQLDNPATAALTTIESTQSAPAQDGEQTAVVEALATLTGQLNDVLVQETALLEKLDLGGAGSLVSRKRDAVASLQAMLATAGGVTGLGAERSEKLRDCVQRMSELAEANRLSLERGLSLQMQLIRLIAKAVPRARADEAPIYQPDGTKLPPRPPEAYAFLSRM